MLFLYRNVNHTSIMYGIVGFLLLSGCPKGAMLTVVLSGGVPATCSGRAVRGRVNGRGSDTAGPHQLGAVPERWSRRVRPMCPWW